MQFNTNFLLRNDPHSGVHCQRSKIFRQHGKQNTTTRSIPCTRMQSMMDLKNSKSTTPVLIRNQVIFLHQVSEFQVIHHFKIKLIVRTLVLHPYYKLTYIKLAWGGEEEQQAECDAGQCFEVWSGPRFPKKEKKPDQDCKRPKTAVFCSFKTGLFSFEYFESIDILPYFVTLI